MKQLALSAALAISLLFVSWIPNKNLIYLQSKNGSDSGKAISEVMVRPCKLHIDAILSKNIKANEPKLVSIFTTSKNEEAG